jgi:O-antigen/teichoic acid export membrane protein
MKLPNRPGFLSDFAWKSTMLIAGRGSAMGLSFFTSMIIARAMGGDEYGRYTLVMALVNWGGIAFTFGLDSAPKMLAALQEPDLYRSLLGGFFAFTGGMSFFFTLALWMCSFFVDTIFHYSVGNILRWAAPLAGANLFQVLIEWACFGLRKPGILSAILFASRLINLITALIFVKLGIVAASSYYLVFLLSTWVFPIVGWLTLRPTFTGLKHNLLDIWTDMGLFGKYAYIGRVPAVLANNLDRLLLGYFASTRQVGFYGLSQSLTNPVIFVGGAISQVAYRDFSNAPAIQRKMIISTLIVSGLACLATFGFGVICVKFFLPPEFRDMLPLLFILIFSGLFQSLYAPFMAFISAKGSGKMLRNFGWTSTLFSVGFYTIFIPLWGAIGAVSATSLISFLLLIQAIWLYSRLIKSKSSNPPVSS